MGTTKAQLIRGYAAALVLGAFVLWLHRFDSGSYFGFAAFVGWVAAAATVTIREAAGRGGWGAGRQWSVIAIWIVAAAAFSWVGVEAVVFGASGAAGLILMDLLVRIKRLSEP